MPAIDYSLWINQHDFMRYTKCNYVICFNRENSVGAILGFSKNEYGLEIKSTDKKNLFVLIR